MRDVKAAKSFKKDLKRYANQPARLKELYDIVDKLRRGEELPKRSRPHMLIGDYAGHMECHIGNDFLLIWFDKEENLIKLVRLGSHSELFG